MSNTLRGGFPLSLQELPSQRSSRVSEGRSVLARSFRASYRSRWSGSWGRAASGGRGALTFRNGRETVRGRHAIFTAARDPKQNSP
jgi:hypothetical protein